jgi:hypothetical protein
MTPGTHWIGGWIGPRARLDAVEEKNLASAGNRTQAVPIQTELSRLQTKLDKVESTFPNRMTSGTAFHATQSGRSCDVWWRHVCIRSKATELCVRLSTFLSWERRTIPVYQLNGLKWTWPSATSWRRFLDWILSGTKVQVTTKAMHFTSHRLSTACCRLYIQKQIVCNCVKMQNNNNGNLTINIWLLF